MIKIGIWMTILYLKRKKNIKIRKYAKELKEKINNYLGIYLYVGHYVNPLPCES